MDSKLEKKKQTKTAYYLYWRHLSCPEMVSLEAVPLTPRRYQWAEPPNTPNLVYFIFFSGKEKCYFLNIFTKEAICKSSVSWKGSQLLFNTSFVYLEP